MDAVFGFADDLGPAKVTHVHEPGIGLKGIVVVDDVAIGPLIGGPRSPRSKTRLESIEPSVARTISSARRAGERKPYGSLSNRRFRPEGDV